MCSMGKRLGLIVIATLLMTGCASGDPEAAPAVTVTASATPEAAPITMEAVAPDAVEDPEAAFLDAVKENWLGDVPADGELIKAGNYACEEFPKGLHYTEIVAVSGDDWQAGDNNLKVTGNAGRYLCPEFEPSN
jgi:hypothetical protein